MHSSPRTHGGPRADELRRLGVDPGRLIDFSVNTNPYGPSPAVIEAIARAAIDRYPDPTAHAVCEAMAPLLAVRPAQLALGNGAAELLWTLARGLLSKTTCVLIVEPTFSEFRAAAGAVGARILEHRTLESEQFQIDLARVTSVIRAEDVRVLYLCVPNTPTGVALPARDVASFAEALPRVTVILDQSFLSLSDRFADAEVGMPPNVVRVRSLTKDHGIPGVRVGYLIATPEIVARVEAERPAWSTSSFCQAAALAACRDASFVSESRAKLRADGARLRASLEALDLRPCASTTPFFLLRAARASDLRLRLLAQHQILVRDCTSFGLPDFIRLAVRPAPDCERLLAALKKELRAC
jgi:histidinol-phosphate aminotransferase